MEAYPIIPKDTTTKVKVVRGSRGQFERKNVVSVKEVRAALGVREMQVESECPSVQINKDSNRDSPSGFMLGGAARALRSG
jgi:hypothetical protein